MQAACINTQRLIPSAVNEWFLELHHRFTKRFRICKTRFGASYPGHDAMNVILDPLCAGTFSQVTTYSRMLWNVTQSQILHRTVKSSSGEVQGSPSIKSKSKSMTNYLYSRTISMTVAPKNKNVWQFKSIRKCVTQKHAKMRCNTFRTWYASTTWYSKQMYHERGNTYRKCAK